MIRALRVFSSRARYSFPNALRFFLRARRIFLHAGHRFAIIRLVFLELACRFVEVLYCFSLAPPIPVAVKRHFASATRIFPDGRDYVSGRIRFRAGKPPRCCGKRAKAP